MTMKNPILDGLVDDYGKVAERTLERVKRGATEVRARQYSADKLLNDTFDAWLDAASLWRSAFDAIRPK